MKGYQLGMSEAQFNGRKLPLGRLCKNSQLNVAPVVYGRQPGANSGAAPQVVASGSLVTSRRASRFKELAHYPIAKFIKNFLATRQRTVPSRS